MFRTWMWVKLFQDFPVFLKGFGMTLLVSLVALILMLVLSLIVGIARVSDSKVLRKICGAYISFFQNTPLMIQVFFFYNVLPRFGIILPTFTVGSLALALYTAAFGSSVIESAILAVPHGQFEAAYSQGFTFLKTMRLIILPQALKVAIPPMTNQMINLIKNSSILTVIALGELMYHVNSWSNEFAIFGPSYVLAAVLYVAVCLPLTRFSKRMEDKLVK